MPLGLIINELVGERLKQAFPEGRHGRISVRLKRAGEQVVLAVSDNGAAFGPQGAPSVGDTLLAALAGQLEAVLENGGAADRTIRVIMPGRLFD
jgi:two-component sensor histidine kinase